MKTKISGFYTNRLLAPVWHDLSQHSGRAATDLPHRVCRALLHLLVRFKIIWLQENAKWLCHLVLLRCILIYIDRGLRRMTLDNAVGLDDMKKKEDGKDVVDNLLQKEEEKRGNE